jgi:hypothetical protein
MPETSETEPETASGPEGGQKAEVLRGARAFGEIQAISRRVSDSAGLVVVVGAGWEMEPAAAAALVEGLAARPGAAFAFGSIHAADAGSECGSGAGAIAIDAEALMVRPREVGPLVIRASEVRRLGWPGFGPPDLVLDGALTWALATAIAVRGGLGWFIPGARFAPGLDGPETIARLRPEGLSWLVSEALRWGPEGALPAALAQRLWRRWTGSLAVAGFDGLTPPGAERA